MLLLRAEGLHSCPQMAWSQIRKTVADIVSPPDELMLFLRHVDRVRGSDGGLHRTGRAPLDETFTFVDG